MSAALIPQELRAIHKKVLRAERVSDADALALYATQDIHALGRIANVIRERKNGNAATYVFNRYINYSNLCLLSCQFCAFGAKKRDAHAFEMAIPDIVVAAREAAAQGCTEIHMVGGLHPSLPADWYLELLRALRAVEPALHLKCFTAIEIRHLAERVFKKPLRETLETLRAAGLDSLTGGGAEIFDPVIRDQICRGKETADEWLEVHRTWHQMGGRSTCTMLFGHIETAEHRVAHLRRLRELQDETGGFVSFVPFAFQPEEARPELRHLRRVGALEELRNLAVSRIYLDNFDHVTAYWVSLGLPLAGVALSYGVDDLHGTIFEEKIFHMAGAQTPQEQSVAALEKAIREAGREPQQRNSHFEHIARTGFVVEKQTAEVATV
jgi:aminodeoxyfutalosine synthase